MSMCRNVTSDDVKHLFGMTGSKLDVLAAVAEIAKDIHDAAIMEKAKSTIVDSAAAPDKHRKSSSSTLFNHHRGKGKHDGEASTSRTNKRRRNYNNLNLKNIDVDKPPAPLPEEFSNKIREMTLKPPTLLIEKELTSSDLGAGHNRLSIPMNQILKKDFLTVEEVQYYERYQEEDTSKKQYKEVRIIMPSLEVETAHFCRWDMKKKNGNTSSVYNINGSWVTIAKKNKLREGMKVQLWSFRVGDELCFALVRLR